MLAKRGRLKIKEEQVASASVQRPAMDKRQDSTFCGKAGRERGYNTRKC